MCLYSLHHSFSLIKLHCTSETSKCNDHHSIKQFWTAGDLGNVMDTEKEQLFLRRKYGNLKEQSLTPWYMMQQQYQEQDVLDIYPDLLNIIAERDAAIEERNQAFLEKDRAFQDRYVAIEQRNFAIRQRNDAVLERNNAFKSLQQSMLESIGQPPCKRLKRDDTTALDVLCKTMTSSECNESPHVNSVPRKRKVTRVPDSKDKINFDETVMPVPGCSCTGVFRPCYKWGSGGWQSCCCTQTISAFPLPHVPNKRRSRKGGRKMTGNVFSKLLSRLAAEGYDFSLPVDLKDHWSKHGTNRYITIK